MNAILVVAVFFAPATRTDLTVQSTPEIKLPAQVTYTSVATSRPAAEGTGVMRSRVASKLLERMLTENFVETANTYPDAKVEGFAVNLMAFAGLLTGSDKQQLLAAAGVFRDQAFSQEEARKAWVDVATILQKYAR